MENNALFKMLNTMPKGALHHIHTTAANTIDSYVELTYDDRVYFNARDGLFKVYPKHQNVANGYIPTKTLREFATNRENVDKELREKILLMPQEANDLESHDIWKGFQHKFTMVGELGKFVPFFKQLTRKALQSCID